MSQQHCRQSNDMDDQDELRELLNHFPHPRHQPLEAVISLHRVRILRDRIIACHKKQGDHAANQDARQ